MQQLYKQHPFQNQGQNQPQSLFNQISSINQTSQQQAQSSSYQNQQGFMENPLMNYSYNQQYSSQNQGMIMLPIISSNSQQSFNQYQNHQSSYNPINRFIPHPNSFGSQNQKEKNGSHPHNQNRSGNKGGQQGLHQNQYNYPYGQQLNQHQSNSQVSNQQHIQQPQQQLQGGQLQLKQQQSKQNSQQSSQQLNSSSSSSSASSSSNNQQQQFRYKTHKCRHFLSGNCTLGEKCNFAHSDKELRDPQDPLPPNILVGQKVQITNFKTVKCRYYDNGYCKNSEKCSFAHGNLELLTPGVTLNNINAFPQQNQLIMSEHQKEQMRKESIDQQNNIEYFKNNINDVISELKHGFTNNDVVLQLLDDAINQLQNDKIEKARLILQSLFEDPQRTNQDKQYILSTIKKYNDHYKILMESKYKEEQIGFNQSNFFLHSSFEGFSQDIQNNLMYGQVNSSITSNSSQNNNNNNNSNTNKNITNNNSMNNNLGSSTQLNSSQQQPYQYQHGNQNSISSTSTSNSNQGNGSSQGTLFGNGSINNISTFNYYQNYSNNNSSCSSNNNDNGKKDNSPMANKFNTFNQQLFSNNFTQSETENNNQKGSASDDSEKQDFYCVSEINQMFKNFNIENYNSEGHNEDVLETFDSDILHIKKEIQDIFSSDNSNLIIIKNAQADQNTVDQPTETEK